SAFCAALTRRARTRGSGRRRRRVDAHLAPVLANALVAHDAVDLREEREVAPAADVAARVDAGADLADEDVPGARDLTGVHLDAAALSLAVAAVAAAALSFFMRHRPRPFQPSGRSARRPRRRPRCRSRARP